MTIAITSPITGQPQTGFTSPTYTNVAGNPPANNAKQYVVTALGGTQTGATAHSVSSPFTISFWLPSKFVSAPVLNQVGAVVGGGFNNYALVLRKGMIPLTNQAPQVAQFTLNMKIPAGADVYSPAEIRAALSCLFGAAVQVSAGLGDTLVQGVM